MEAEESEQIKALREKISHLETTVDQYSEQEDYENADLVYKELLKYQRELEDKLRDSEIQQQEDAIRNLSARHQSVIEQFEQDWQRREEEFRQQSTQEIEDLKVCFRLSKLFPVQVPIVLFISYCIL